MQIRQILAIATLALFTQAVPVAANGGASTRPGILPGDVSQRFEGVVRALASDSVVVSGRRFMVAPDVQVSIRGSYGAFSMLQKGMKVSVIFQQTVDGRFALEIHQLPDNQEIPQV